jgi:hypothetical protein
MIILAAIAYWTLFVGADTWMAQAVQQIPQHATRCDCDRAGQIWQYNAKRSYICKQERY